MLLTADAWQRLPQTERDAAYNNTRAVATSAAQLADFETRSAAVVQANPQAQLDVAYGAAERLRFDFFVAQSGRVQARAGSQGRSGVAGDSGAAAAEAGAGADTLVFIHGGYWQMRHKNTFRFVAQGALAHGLNAALIGYTLAPQASLSRIVAEVQCGIAAVRAHALGQGGSGRILLCGWSAGGHLAAMGLACTGVVAGLGISGIYELAPVAHTDLNTALGLGDEEVQQLSPLRLPVVLKPFVTGWGAAELPQLQAQSQAFAQHRSGMCCDQSVAVPAADHFSVLNALASPNGALLHALLRAAKPTAAAA